MKICRPIAAFLFLCFLPAFSLAYESYYPMSAGEVYHYSAYRAVEPLKELHVSLLFTEPVKSEEKGYLWCRADTMDLAYLLKEDPGGIYMKAMRYPVPFLGFITADVFFSEPTMILKYPVTEGDEWANTLNARASLFLFDFREKVYIRYKTVKTGEIKIDGRNVKYCVVETILTDKDKKEVREKHVYAQGVGYIESETRDHKLRLIGKNGIYFNEEKLR